MSVKNRTMRWDMVRLVMFLIFLAGCSSVANAGILVLDPATGQYRSKVSLAQAATSEDCAGKTIVVTSALSAIQSNISSATVHSWPSDRALKVEHGGSIGNTTKFQIDSPFTAPLTQIFTGSGAVTGLTDIYPEWWGATGDGTTDDTSYLMAMNASIRATDIVQGHTSMFTIHLSSGKTYKYATGNKWAQGVKNLTIDGYGARIQNASTGPDALALYSLIVTSFASGTAGSNTNWWNLAADGVTRYSGSLINTANPGSLTVTLKSSAESSNFQTGWAVVLSKDNQFYGLPSNNEYVDYVKILAVDAGTGVITLDRPLAGYHRDDYPVNGDPALGASVDLQSVGPARIFMLDKSDLNFFMDSLIMKGVTILDNPNLALESGMRSHANSLYIIGVNHAQIIDTNVVDFVPTMSAVVDTKGCTFDMSEIDKLLKQVSFDDCSVGTKNATTLSRGIAGGATDILSIRNCRIYSPIITSAKNLIIEDSKLFGAAINVGYAFGVNVSGNRTARLVNNIFYGKNGSTDYAVANSYPLGATTYPRYFTLSGQLSGSTLTLDLTDTTQRTFAAGIRLGSKVYLVNPAISLNQPTAGIFGVVTAMTNSDSTHAQYTLRLNGAIPDGSKIAVRMLESFYAVGNRYENFDEGNGSNYYGTGIGVQWVGRTYVTEKFGGENDIFRLHAIQGQYANLVFSLGGRVITKIEATVTKAYTGAATTATAYIESFNPTAAHEVINLKTLGTRAADYANVYNAKTGDTLVAITDNIANTCRVVFSALNGADTADMAGEVSFTIYTHNRE